MCNGRAKQSRNLWNSQISIKIVQSQSLPVRKPKRADCYSQGPWDWFLVCLKQIRARFSSREALPLPKYLHTKFWNPMNFAKILVRCREVSDRMTSTIWNYIISKCQIKTTLTWFIFGHHQDLVSGLEGNLRAIFCLVVCQSTVLLKQTPCVGGWVGGRSMLGRKWVSLFNLCRCNTLFKDKAFLSI